LLHGRLVLKMFPCRGRNPGQWRGLTVKAVDKTTLNLPETKKLFKKFGSHRGARGRGPVSAELCCIFAVLPRVPLAWITGKASTNEKPMFKRLMRKLRKGDLLLLDNGFYSFRLMKMVVERGFSLIIPVSKNTRPKVVRKLREHEWMVEISDSRPGHHGTLLMRLIYVYRDGFRRRRILTSLTDTETYPSTDIAWLYHRRWDIETFYSDFKTAMQARKWHCQSPDTFEKELAMHMIAFVLIRRTMLEAARKLGDQPASLSFSRALTEARAFMRKVAGAVLAVARDAYECFVKECSRYVVKSKPGRSFTRDKQEYRAKTRGLKKKRRGRPPKQTTPFVPFARENAAPETVRYSDGYTYALS